MQDQEFAQRIRERYPEGLTGIFAIGGTRTTYILEHNRSADDPGHIADFSAQAAYLMERYHAYIRMFFDLGGQNMIITASSFRGFAERGPEYAELIQREMPRLIDSTSQRFYQEHEIDPYFVGVDVFANLSTVPTRDFGRPFHDFQQHWEYRPGRRKLIWEIASIPLYSFWRVFQSMDEDQRAQLDAALAAAPTLEAMHRLLYEYFSRAVYGTEVPMPHFYLGTNKSGDLKWRSPMPIALTGGEYMRMFYTPYPSLFITPDTMRAILQDLAFNERFHSLKTDYRGRYTTDLVQAEYERVRGLSDDPRTIVGLSRKVETPTP